MKLRLPLSYKIIESCFVARRGTLELTATNYFMCNVPFLSLSSLPFFQHSSTNAKTKNLRSHQGSIHLSTTIFQINSKHHSIHPPSFILIIYLDRPSLSSDPALSGSPSCLSFLAIRSGCPSASCRSRARDRCRGAGSSPPPRWPRSILGAPPRSRRYSPATISRKPVQWSFSGSGSSIRRRWILSGFSGGCDRPAPCSSRSPSGFSNSWVSKSVGGFDSSRGSRSRT